MIMSARPAKKPAGKLNPKTSSFKGLVPNSAIA
jgi:hypothetical protein